MVSYPGLMFFLWMVSYPSHGTKNCKRIGLVHSLVSATVHWVYLQIFLSQVPQELILITAPKLQEGKVVQRMKKVALTLVTYIFILSLLWCPMRCHGTRIARGVPLPVYMNVDVYSGFWCTSHCVVF